MRFSGVTVAPDGQAEIDAMNAARGEYLDASQTSLTHAEQLASIRAELLRIETEIVANAGYEGFPIDGKNKEQRDAQTDNAFLNSPAWMLAKTAERDTEADLKNAQAEMVYAEHAMRAARVTLEFWASRNYFEAAATGGLLPDHNRGER